MHLYFKEHLTVTKLEKSWKLQMGQINTTRPKASFHFFDIEEMKIVKKRQII